MLNKNRDEIKRYITMAKEVMEPCPTDSEEPAYIIGFFSSQAETIGMLLDKIEGVINRQDEEEF